MNTSAPAQPIPQARDEKLKQMNGVFLLFIVAGFVAALQCTTWNHAATVGLWALACLAVGAFIGLLFGIPRMRKKERPANGAPPATDDEKYEPEINNNLIEVSDWLTKIIVGLGLVELGSFPEKLKLIAGPLATCLHAECGLAAAVGVIVFFTASGFLAGYINARTFIAVMFRDSDANLMQRIRDVAEKVEANTVAREVQESTTSAQLQVMRHLVESSGSSAVAAFQAPAGVAGEKASAEPDAALLEMAKSYEAITDPSYRVRVSKKEDAANRMLRHILRARIPKSRLLAWAEAQSSDGLIIAYAAYVLTVPHADDLAGLVRLAPKADWLHVKFRVTMAFRALANEGVGGVEEWKQALGVLERYHRDADNRDDAPLVNLTQQVIEMVRTRIEAT